jgi:hypothetical protein
MAQLVYVYLRRHTHKNGASTAADIKPSPIRPSTMSLMNNRRRNFPKNTAKIRKEGSFALKYKTTMFTLHCSNFKRLDFDNDSIVSISSRNMHRIFYSVVLFLDFTLLDFRHNQVIVTRINKLLVLLLFVS